MCTSNRNDLQYGDTRVTIEQKGEIFMVFIKKYWYIILIEDREEKEAGKDGSGRSAAGKTAQDKKTQDEPGKKGNEDVAHRERNPPGRRTSPRPGQS